MDVFPESYQMPKLVNARLKTNKKKWNGKCLPATLRVRTQSGTGEPDHKEPTEPTLILEEWVQNNFHPFSTRTHLISIPNR